MPENENEQGQVTAIPVTELNQYVDNLLAQRQAEAEAEAQAQQQAEAQQAQQAAERTQIIGQLMQANQGAQPQAENQEGQRYNVAVGHQRDADLHLQTFRLLRAVATRDTYLQHQVQRDMERMGFESLGDVGQGEETRVMSTDTEGQPFLPVLVANTIEELREQFGLGRQLATVWQMTSGTMKVPSTTNRPSVFAVNEGAMILARKPDFNNVVLDPKKWGIIVPYTTEMSDEAGAQWMPKIIDQVGRAFAEAEDQTIWLADGTANYHNIKGLFNLDTPLSEVVGPAGGIGGTTRTNLLDMIVAAHYGGRGNGVYAFHPDMEYVFAKWEDSAGRPYYPVNESITRMIKPLRFTAALPALADDAINLDFGTFGDHSVVNVGVKRGISVKLLDQATIQDVDDSTLIHLGAQDSLALRFTARWDVKISGDVQANVSKITTAAT